MFWTSSIIHHYCTFLHFSNVVVYRQVVKFRKLYRWPPKECRTLAQECAYIHLSLLGPLRRLLLRFLLSVCSSFLFQILFLVGLNRVWINLTPKRCRKIPCTSYTMQVLTPTQRVGEVSIAAGLNGRQSTLTELSRHFTSIAVGL